jgi:hypothetical protein
MFGEFAKRGPMSTDAIPHINTNDLPLPTARDDGWRIVVEQPAPAIEVERLCDAVLTAATGF